MIILWSSFVAGPYAFPFHNGLPPFLCGLCSFSIRWRQYSKGNDGYLYYFMDPPTSGSYTYLTEDEFILRWHDSLEGKSKRIGIEVSYLNPISEVPINVAYHID